MCAEICDLSQEIGKMEVKKMKLNIYNKKREVVKTYECDNYKLMYGTIMDLTKAIDLKEVVKVIDNRNEDVNMFISIMTDTIYNALDLIEDILKDVFDGLTDDELRMTNINEIIDVIIELVQTSMPIIMKAFKKSTEKEKN